MLKAANSWGLTRAHNIDVLCQQLCGCIVILMKVLTVKSNLHVWRRCRNGHKSTEFQSQRVQAKQEHTHTLSTSSAAWHLANGVFGFACGITINHLSLIANGSLSRSASVMCLIMLPEFKLFWTHNLRKGAEVKCLIKSGHDFDLLDKFMSPIVESLRCGHSGAKMPGKSNNHNYYERFRRVGEHWLPGKLIISTRACSQPGRMELKLQQLQEVSFHKRWQNCE